MYKSLSLSTGLKSLPFVGIAEREVRKIILRDRAFIGRIVVAVSASSLSDVRAVDARSEGNHVLMDHSAEEGVST